MARANQRDTNPVVDAQIFIVNDDAFTGPRSNYVTKMAERKKMREEYRVAVLMQWEAENLSVGWEGVPHKNREQNIN